MVARDAHAVVVDELVVVVAATLGRAVGARETGLRATAVVERARVELAALPLWRKHLQQPSDRILKSCSQHTPSKQIEAWQS